LGSQKGELEPLVPFDEVLLAVELGDVAEELAKVVVGHLGKGGRQGREISKGGLLGQKQRITRG
jgi:hypothetical protein